MRTLITCVWKRGKPKNALQRKIMCQCYLFWKSMAFLKINLFISGQANPVGLQDLQIAAYYDLSIWELPHVDLLTSRSCNLFCVRLFCFKRLILGKARGQSKQTACGCLLATGDNQSPKATMPFPDLFDTNEDPFDISESSQFAIFKNQH